MAVTHFKRNEKVICNTVEQKYPLLFTDDEEDVTCKKCLKKLSIEALEAEKVE